MYKWKCEQCDWKGDYPEVVRSYQYLGTKEEETELDWIEVCPKCEQNGKMNIAVRNWGIT